VPHHRHTVRRVLWPVLVIAAWLGFAHGSHAAAEILHSYAIINGDATMLVRGKLVRLYGIFVPEDDRLCSRIMRPAMCGTRAAVALDLKVRQFVRCEIVAEYDDGSVGAYCAVGAGRFSDGEDLGAFLIRQGLAMAGPDAPFEYQALERIAAANGRGVWGFQADSIRLRPRYN
jgi:endonuclease YncB( thermonuclease family)